MKKKSDFTTIILLILSGECIYILPYVLARIFRPTFLDVFNLSNFELGSLFSVYGIVAIFSYLFGGVIADNYPGNLGHQYVFSMLVVFSLFGLIASIKFAEISNKTFKLIV